MFRESSDFQRPYVTNVSDISDSLAPETDLKIGQLVGFGVIKILGEMKTSTERLWTVETVAKCFDRIEQAKISPSKLKPASCPVSALIHGFLVYLGPLCVEENMVFINDPILARESLFRESRAIRVNKAIKWNPQKRISRGEQIFEGKITQHLTISQRESNYTRECLTLSSR
jgi:hypothetical protein